MQKHHCEKLVSKFSVLCASSTQLKFNLHFKFNETNLCEFGFTKFYQDQVPLPYSVDTPLKLQTCHFFYFFGVVSSNSAEIYILVFQWFMLFSWFSLSHWSRQKSSKYSPNYPARLPLQRLAEQAIPPHLQNLAPEILGARTPHQKVANSVLPWHSLFCIRSVICVYIVASIMAMIDKFLVFVKMVAAYQNLICSNAFYWSCRAKKHKYSYFGGKAEGLQISKEGYFLGKKMANFRDFHRFFLHIFLTKLGRPLQLCHRF